MSVTELIDGIAFHYRVLSDTKDVYIQWHMKAFPELFNGKAYSHEERIEQMKQAVKELRKLNNRNKTNNEIYN